MHRRTIEIPADLESRLIEAGHDPKVSLPALFMSALDVLGKADVPDESGAFLVLDFDDLEDLL